MSEDNQTRGHLLAVFTVLIWGTTFVFTKVLLETFTPIEIMITRFVLGFLALLIVGKGWMKAKERKHELYFIGAGITGVTLYFLLENIALTYASASLIGVVVSVAPLFTALMTKLFYREEKIGKFFFLGFLCAITGVALVSVSGVNDLDFSPLGGILAVLASLVWGIYSVLIRKISKFGYETVSVTGRIFFYGLIFLIPAGIWDGFPHGIMPWFTMFNFLGLLFLGFGASAACFVTWNKAVSILGPVKTSVYIYAVPVVTIAFSMLFLKETMTPVMAIGTILALFGLILSEKKQIRRDR